MLDAAKTGTNAFAPFTRRVLFGFGGWRESSMSSCGSRYILPRELTISPNGTLQQHPAVELKGLRQGPAIQAPPGAIANGAQIEVLVRCKLPASGVPKAGVVGVTTLAHGSQVGVSVGYDFSNQTHPGFVPAGLSNGLGARTDRAPLREALRGDTLELQVFVDGQIIETFFDGKSTTCPLSKSKC